MTGFTDDQPSAQAMPTDPPDIGAICQHLKLGPKDLPGAVCLPCFPGSGQKGHRRRGPYGGFLGRSCDPLFTLCKPTFDREPSPNDYDPVMPMGQPFPPTPDDLPEMTVNRLDERKSLLTQLDTVFAESSRSPAVTSMDQVKQKAFSILTSGRTRDAFDLEQESSGTRDRYGQNLVGSSMLIARRLVEAGCSFVTMVMENPFVSGLKSPKLGFYNWDSHAVNCDLWVDARHRFPVYDKAVTALIEDLHQRGLTEKVLLVVTGEFGRSPKISRADGGSKGLRYGREHWPRAMSVLVCGGGMEHGQVVGSTNALGEHPHDRPLTPNDLWATIYKHLGIDQNATIPDHTGRPQFILPFGKPIAELL